MRVRPSVPPPGRLYDVDGLALHLVRRGPPGGAPGPVLVIEAGMGGSSPVYARLMAALAERFEVCTHDRPGTGWSAFDGTPFDARRQARQLHALLAAAGVRGPIVHIGHSLGGLLGRVYTALYPDQVAGVVMIDASHPRQAAENGPLSLEGVALMRESFRAFQAGGPVPPEVAVIEDELADLPETVRQWRAVSIPEAVDAMAIEARDWPGVCDEAARSGPLGDRPLAVLWGPAAPPVPEGEAYAHARAMRERWPRYQQEHAALSTRGWLRAIEGANHYTLVLVPAFVERVADEIARVVALARGGSTRR